MAGQAGHEAVGEEAYRVGGGGNEDGFTLTQGDFMGCPVILLVDQFTITRDAHYHHERVES